MVLWVVLRMLQHWIQDKTGFDTRTVGPAIMDWLGIGGGNAGTAANQYSVNGDSLRGSAMSLSSGNAPVHGESYIQSKS
jgi:hypothetical protein